MCTAFGVHFFGPSCNTEAACPAMFPVTTMASHIWRIYNVSQKSPLRFSDIFPKRLGIFSPNFTSLLLVSIYARLQIFL